MKMHLPETAEAYGFHLSLIVNGLGLRPTVSTGTFGLLQVGVPAVQAGGDGVLAHMGWLMIPFAIFYLMLAALAVVVWMQLRWGTFSLPAASLPRAGVGVDGGRAANRQRVSPRTKRGILDRHATAKRLGALRRLGGRRRMGKPGGSGHHPRPRTGRRGAGRPGLVAEVSNTPLTTRASCGSAATMPHRRSGRTSFAIHDEPVLPMIRVEEADPEISAGRPVVQVYLRQAEVSVVSIKAMVLAFDRLPAVEQHNELEPMPAAVACRAAGSRGRNRDFRIRCPSRSRLDKIAGKADRAAGAPKALAYRIV